MTKATVDIVENSELDFDHAVEFVCTCGLRGTVGTTKDGQMVALHELPTCPLYDRSDALEFVTAIRRHYEGS